VLILATAAGLVVWTRTEITTLRYRLTRLLEQEATIRAGVEKLKIEEAALSSTARVESEAGALGLIDPRPARVIHLAELEGKR
jgi:cell division protein FtsL